RKDDALESFELWMKNAVGKSACDFTFHMGVAKFNQKTEKQLRQIVKRGISSFKIFLAYKGAFGVDDTELYRTLKLAKELGVIVTAHCENETLVAELQKELLAAGKTDPGQHHESRPPAVEAEGVHHLMTFAELTGAATYIVHLSCREALEQAIAARQRGVRVAVETLIQYLTLDKTCTELPKFEGAKYVMSPPLRDKRNQPILWNGLRDGLVQTVATDHCPFDFRTQKTMGKNDFTKIPNGIPSLEERIKLLYTYGVKAGKIDLHTFVNVASTQVAKTFDIFPRKGTIQIGADADLVVFDPDYRGKISATQAESFLMSQANSQEKQNSYRADAVRFFEWCRFNLHHYLEKLDDVDKRDFELGSIPTRVFDTVRVAWSDNLKTQLPWNEHFAVIRKVLPNSQDYDLWMNCPMGQLKNLPRRIQTAVANGDKRRLKEIHRSFFANQGDTRISEYLRIWQSQEMAMHKLMIQALGYKHKEGGGASIGNTEIDFEQMMLS